MEAPAPAITRSRRGCRPCRKKRVKCDELRPVCTRCTRQGSVCDYSMILSWEDDSFVARKAHGRVGTRPGRQRTDYRPYAPQGTNLPSKHGNLIVPSPLSGIAPSSDSSESFLLNYYASVICPQAPLVEDTAVNPLLRFVLPTALSIPAGRSGTVMMMADLLSPSHDDYPVVKYHSREHVLTQLRQMVTGTDWVQTNVNAVILLSMHLCSYAISNGQDWSVHLSCIAHVLTLPHSAPEVHYFLVKYFASHVILRKAVVPSEEKLGWATSANFSKFMPIENRDVADVWTGCCDGLFLAINDITAVRDDVYSLNKFSQVSNHDVWLEHLRRLVPIQQYVTTLRQLGPDVRTSDRDENGVPTRIMHVAKTYENAVILYLDCVARFIIDHLDTNTEDHVLPIALLSTTQKLDHAHAVFHHLERSLAPKFLAPTWPQWPLYVAGSLSESAEDQRRALSLFDLALHKAPYGNILPTRKAMTDIWKGRGNDDSRLLCLQDRSWEKP